MIDITVDSNEVKIDMKVYPVNSKGDLIELIQNIIDKAKYSGESITLWRAKYDGKILIKEW